MNHPTILQAAAAERVRDLIAQADAHRLATSAIRIQVHEPTGLVVRMSAPADAAALERLAVLDDGRVPNGPVFVAEARGVMVAAVGIDGAAIADPFVPTEAVVRALRSVVRELHAGRGIPGRPGTIARWARRLHPLRSERRPACTS